MQQLGKLVRVDSKCYIDVYLATTDSKHMVYLHRNKNWPMRDHWYAAAYQVQTNLSVKTRANHDKTIV